MELLTPHNLPASIHTNQSSSWHPVPGSGSGLGSRTAQDRAATQVQLLCTVYGVRCTPCLLGRTPLLAVCGLSTTPCEAPLHDAAPVKTRARARVSKHTRACTCAQTHARAHAHRHRRAHTRTRTTHTYAHTYTHMCHCVHRDRHHRDDTTDASADTPPVPRGAGKLGSTPPRHAPLSALLIATAAGPTRAASRAACCWPGAPPWSAAPRSPPAAPPPAQGVSHRRIYS